MVTRKIFKCFISSPGDCQEERDVCVRVVNEITVRFGKHFGIGLETFMWEYDVLPDMGKNGQDIIDEYVKKSNYDVFIGIMKNRFGHPTKKAGSGTEHEFNDAIRRKIKMRNSHPKILFFFGKEKVDPDMLDFDQYSKVKDFKERISSLGLYIPFSGMDEFRGSLTQKLELFIQENSQIENAEDRVKEIDVTLKYLENDLSESLKTYNEKSPIWIDPIISSKQVVPSDPTKNFEHKVDLVSLITEPKNIIIKAPSEFGLTSLAHYLKLEAWKLGKVFLYIDSKKTKKHKIVKDIKREVGNYYFANPEKIDCILIDSICFDEQGVMQMVKNVCDEFLGTPIILFNTLDNNFFLKSEEDDRVEITRKFLTYYLLPLPQTELRKIVTSYTKQKEIPEDHNVMLEKVAKDLQTLNMHRTAKNCMSILRASFKIGSEYNPINRTKLLETMLNTIFEEYEIPTFHDKKPDVKDCSFVLGYLCELLIVKNDFYFTENYFKSELKGFCNANLIDLDLTYLLTVLKDNSILGQTTSNHLYFKNTYWVFFFIAQRMNLNKAFLEQVYENKRYVDFPEIIEFYTGIDRNKDDALSVLSQDLDETLLVVREKMNIPDLINPYKSISWNPDVPSLEKEQEKIKDNVITSGLPDEVKDKYADKHYDQIKPYNQVINSVFRDYSFLVLMRQISATARALRNSDFVSIGLKKEVLDKITQAWSELNKLLIVLHPLLADRGNVAFEGARFELDEGDFKFDTPIEKRNAVLLSIPTNVVKFFKDDLFSTKMGPLLIDRAINETNSLIKHELMLLIIAERPNSWYKTIDDYIVGLDKNSFFLSDVLTTLKFNKDFKATEENERRAIELLAQKCRAKHIFKKNNPDPGLINRARKL
ncbi:DUF4062 domain-containing protein [Marinoscillum furvescens]|uniref:Uncharacterized protein DUF4062 n=1 Tax=Marinoscillum furvescens DSM 4134 TaxID=1122208 RepID=A0A3D9L406_MARFU|nr:DUF4062 domain-containing protein [Marinoscillum furvescens]REE00189.1 uncharacterized protein DUF4062 [Marinoscillum furvescens DSM 4134]